MAVTGSVTDVHSDVITKLKAISTSTKKDVEITSKGGKRTGKADKSAHNTGIAVDIKISGMKTVAIADELVKQDFSGVGEYYTATGQNSTLRTATYVGSTQQRIRESTRRARQRVWHYSGTERGHQLEASIPGIKERGTDCGSRATPTLVLKGKYRIAGNAAVPSFDVMLDVVDYLIAAEAE